MKMRTPSDIGRRTFVGSAVGWSAALMAGRATAQSSAQTAAQASKDTRVAKVTATAVSVPCEYRAGTVVRKVKIGRAHV